MNYIIDRYLTIDNFFQRVTESISLPTILNQKICSHAEVNMNECIQLNINEIDQYKNPNTDTIFRSVSLYILMIIQLLLFNDYLIII